MIPEEQGFSAGSMLPWSRPELPRGGTHGRSAFFTETEWRLLRFLRRSSTEAFCRGKQ